VVRCPSLAVTLVHKQHQTQIQVLRLLSDIARDNSKDILVILRRIGSNQDQAIQSFYYQKFGMNEDQTGMDADDFEMDAPTITVTDEKGQTLTCYVEHSLKRMRMMRNRQFLSQTI
jgi:hypothetical protein